MTDPVPYVPGRPASPPAPQPPAAAAPVVVGPPVDLAHELAALRKLHVTNLLLGSVTFVLALAATIFSGFVAYELWRFLAALQRAFG